MAGLARLVKERKGADWIGWPGKEGFGEAKRGANWQGWYGNA